MHKQRLSFGDDVTEEKGENARLSAFVGAIAVGDLVKSTLGPKGMDKILQSASWIFVDANVADHIKKTALSIQDKYKFFLRMNRIDASVELTQCLIHSFAKTLSRYCLRVANSVFDRLYNDSYDDFAVISIAWSWSSCKSNLSTLFIKNTSLYSFNSTSKVCVLSAFVIQLITLFIVFTWCSTIDSLTTLIMTRAYTVD